MRRRKCAACREWFKTRNALQMVCSPECALEHVKAQKLKQAERDHQDRKKDLKPMSYWLGKAQTAFNAYIRMRDAGLPCVSCGRYHEGQWHAGHYRPVGGQGSALRFNEINCHRQCSVCNNHHSGRLTDYRENLIHRIGLPLVEWLEKDHPPANWNRPMLEAIEKYYKDAVKACNTSTNTYNAIQERNY